MARSLASYALEARARINDQGNLPALLDIRKALEDALGMEFKGEDGDHFFRATLVQTLFYGVFSVWVLWARDNSGTNSRFHWHETIYKLHVPMIKSLFEKIATRSNLESLKIYEVLDWTETLLGRVNRDTFFDKFKEEYAVLYFYEPFLKAYDPELRKQLGVWYTPPEIVKYQVERVDQVLRTELNLDDGLADKNVVILDPCCGTGAYLVETLKRIHKTLKDKGEGAMLAHNLKEAAIKRVFGFEILPAPFVVLHLQIGLTLRSLQAPLAEDSDERAGVFLTNALTGWEPLKDPKSRIPISFPGFDEERNKADEIKQEKTILVIIGNPPYNAFAGTSPDEEGELVEPYKKGLTTPLEDGGWGIKKFNLDDLYVRFFRIAERRIAKTGKGIVSFISNYSWSSEPSFVVMRQHLLNTFDKIWIENMHGNRKISEYAPDGKTSQTVFAIPGFSSGIQQGVVISLSVRKEDHKKRPATILYRNDLDAAKAVDRREQLLASLKLKNMNKKYTTSKPIKETKFSFRPLTIEKEYLAWPKLTDISQIKPFNGLMEKRGGALINIDYKKLKDNMITYFDKYSKSENVLLKLRSGYVPSKVRENAQEIEKFESKRIVKYCLRPFDRACNYFCVRDHDVY